MKHLIRRYSENIFEYLGETSEMMLIKTTFVEEYLFKMNLWYSEVCNCLREGKLFFQKKVISTLYFCLYEVNTTSGSG